MTTDIPLITIEGLKTDFHTDEGVVSAVKGIDIVIPHGRCVSVVGESGSGKSVTAFSTIGLVASPGVISGGRILLHDKEGNVDHVLTDLDPRGPIIRSIRGKRIAMIFQEPMTSLSPVHTVGFQIVEAIILHTKKNKAEAKQHAIKMLAETGIPDAEKRFDAYPHELSGGLRQRVMIAMALSCEPELLIADEPTTALDVTIQAQILELLLKMKNERHMGILFITHDMGVVAQISDEVVVMYRGNVVENGATDDIFNSPKHEYTQALLAAVPSITDDRDRFLSKVGSAGDEAPSAKKHRVEYDKPPILEVTDMRKYFSKTTGFFTKTTSTIKAVDDVSFNLYKGECLGLVGESGSGKTTVGHCILRAQKPTSGKTIYRLNGKEYDLSTIDGKELRKLRQSMGLIFQDPMSSLNPRMIVQDIVAEPMLLAGIGTRAERLARVKELIVRVGLLPEHLSRFPHAFSGGQRQRIGIARALVLNPQFVMADEAVSALDVSVQADVLMLMRELQAEMGISYLFVSHDLSVVRHIADRVAVMYYGRLVELASTDELFSNPLHPYTRALLSAVPVPDPAVKMKRIDVGIEPPDPANPPCACDSFPQCPKESDPTLPDPELVEVSPGHFLRCHEKKK